ncbi:MAG TPA: chemotaxis protein CheB [Rudaea sp.]
MTSQGTVRVALLNQTNQHGDHLKDALRELGAMVVYEALATDIDRDALEGSGARVVVVNLDDGSDAWIDEVYDLLDAGDYEVVFNEAQTSARLSGWDLARWARHLAAKILHKPDNAMPPRPPGAEAVPTPVQKSAAGVPVADTPGRYETQAPQKAEMPPPAATALALEPLEEPTLEMPALDEFAAPRETPAAPEFAAPAPRDVAPPPSESFDDFIMPAPAPAPSPSAADKESSDFAAELDALFANAGMSAPAPSPHDELSIDIDESITMESAEPPAPIDVTNTPKADPAADDGFGDFDLSIDMPSAAPARSSNAEDDLALEFPAIFEQLDSAAADVPSAEENPFKANAPDPEPAPAPSAKKTESILPPDWGLEPVEEPAEDDDTKPAAKTAKPSAESFGIEKMSAQDYLAHDVEEATEQQKASLPTASGLKLELMPIEEAVAPETPATAYKSEAWLDGSRKAQKVRTGFQVIERVVVLGASIGGPEAVREFLVALPAGFPVLFVLAQHMGEEFLELMSAQLAKAVALTVRNPVHGERVGHGDVVVVPTTHRLKFDNEGVVTLAHLPERPAFNPSIDMVLRDVADQFGDKAGAIIFSGMAHDAIDGSQHMKSRGGEIWVQDPDSCAISTMVDGVREAGVVSFTGTPQQLAAKMIAEYGKA